MAKVFLNSFQSFIPAFSASLHKGSNGRVGIIGGSLEYTGAPFFAAISALKIGADLVHVFCCKDAAPVIKSYSPELIVHPLLDAPNAVNEIKFWLDRLHALVIGPGLGTNLQIQKTVLEVINVSKNIPIVIDADGLRLIPAGVALFLDRPCIITPNAIEYKRLSQDSMLNHLNGICLKKGAVDNIIQLPSLEIIASCDLEGSFRRCGGQGDVLAGVLGTFCAWLFIQKCTTDQYKYAVAAACAVTRTCSSKAFKKFRRSMVTSDMIGFLGESFEELFPGAN